ncbi:MAG: cell division protein FtsL [Veillonella sp.]|nr:cell division protein FtsL [Veillonella sp.]MBP9625356.1 cell division protein FtsL [Veillonella sp.]
MRQVVSLFLVLVIAITAFSVIKAVNTKIGYDVVDMQKEVVQLSKQNDELRLNVAELNSPTRIQQIAQDKLGMVLPDAFVYNSKGTTVERDVQVTKRIID